MAMKFVPLDGKKDPPFGKKLIIICKDEYWTQAFLTKIETTDIGKSYLFNNGENKHEDATHFMEIEPPKNNQQ